MDASDCDVASTDWGHWHGIPWRDVFREVGRLQARIAKAAKAGEWRKVRNLHPTCHHQHHATTSYRS